MFLHRPNHWIVHENGSRLAKLGSMLRALANAAPADLIGGHMDDVRIPPVYRQRQTDDSPNQVADAVVRRFAYNGAQRFLPVPSVSWARHRARMSGLVVVISEYGFGHLWDLPSSRS